MKKAQLALLIGSILITANSSADTTLYGELHNSLDIVNVGASSKLASLSNNKSLLGIKGGEKITDNLSAIYQIEFGVALGDGNGLTDRDQYVGIKTAVGTITAGRMSTPFKQVGRKADLFWSSQLGQNRNLTRSNRSIRTGVSAGLDDWDGRFDNTIQYSTPEYNGFQASIARVTESQNDGRGLWSANLFYEKQGLTVGVGCEKHDKLNVAGITFMGAKASRVMAAYDAGKVKFTTLYQEAIDQGYTRGYNSSVAGFGISAKFGKGIAKAQYYRASDLHRPDLASGTDNNGASMLAVGYDYNLSKRTSIYAQYAQINNDSNGGYGLGLGSGGHSASVTTQIDSSGNAKDQAGVSFGLKHSF